jgi:lipopolysaccharide/colanic/teichoic acid biosynthesis glycosyltransferase
MSAQHFSNGNGAFWSPEMTLQGVQVFRRGYLILQPDVAPPNQIKRTWLALRSRSPAMMEYLVLCLAVLSTVIPLPQSNMVSAWLRRATKRALDLVGSSAGLLLTLPIFLIVPILIKLDSPGPIFYTQDRVGLDRRKIRRRVLRAQLPDHRRRNDRRDSDHSGQIFKLLKFRSMVNNAERSCGPVWASKNDPRITRLGRFLRRSRIDELPQLINVVIGQMSLVGPRPERPHFVFKFCDRIDQYPIRHCVKPGITGLAQIENGYDCDENDVHRKVEYDLHYIRRWTPVLDLRILLRTVRVVFSGWGAR